MDIDLLSKVKAKMPDINPQLGNGLAFYQMRDVELYIDEIMQCAARDFPEGLTYDGDEPCTPEQEFAEITKPRDSRSMCDIARNDFYMRAYRFSYHGQDLFKRYIYLPFVGPGGLLYIRGKQYAIAPTLSDTAFEVGPNSMFLQVTRARLSFERLIHHFVLDGHRKTNYVVWSWIHHIARKKNSKKTPGRIFVSCMANYLFTKHGFAQAMAEYAGADVVVGYDEINHVTYPPEEWHIATSIGTRPKSFPHKKTFHAPNIRVAIPKDQYNQQAQNLLVGFFYIADHFPTRLRVENVNDPWVWKIVLGHIINPPDTSEGLMVTEVEEHLESIDEYIDTMVKRELQLAGILHDDIYELFMYVIDELAKPTLVSDSDISSMYGKRLVTLKDVLFPIQHNINNFLFALKKEEKKRGKLEANDIVNLMNRRLKSRQIFEINKSDYPMVTPISTSNDNMFFSITSVLCSNSARNNGKRGKLNLQDPQLHLHVSIAEIAAYNNLPKSDPTGRSRVNPCLQLDPISGRVMRNPKHKAMLDHVQTMIRM